MGNFLHKYITLCCNHVSIDECMADWPKPTPDDYDFMREIESGLNIEHIGNFRRLIAKKDTQSIKKVSDFLSQNDHYYKEINDILINYYEKECEDYLKEAAYYLWLDAGRPEGDGKEFWYKAEKIIKEN